VRRRKANDVCRAVASLAIRPRSASQRERRLTQAHVAEEEEGGLLLAESFEFQTARSLSASTPAVIVTPLPCESVHLVEERVFAQIEEEGEMVNPSRWVVDMGATNHVLGAHNAFLELDISMCGTVRFGDGSVLHIEGCGTVIFSCKSGERRSLSSIYYIPKLKTNILNVGNMDECRFEVLIHSGLMSIRDAENRLVAKIPRAHNRLYVLQARIAQLVCYLACVEEVSWFWHARLGHLGFQTLKKMVREEWVIGLPKIDHNQLCDGWLVHTHRCTSF
jgi:hypothetical protein